MDAVAGEGYRDRGQIDPGTEGGFSRLRLQTAELAKLEKFYRKTMGWAVEKDAGKLSVQAGATRIEFSKAPQGERPYYHIAWAIPSNRFEQGKAWLQERLKLLQGPDGRDEYHFTYARRRAVFFPDPAGNILELVARDDVGDKQHGRFTRDSILWVNHAGLTVTDMDAAIGSIRRELGLQTRGRPSPTFTTLGDGNRHVLLVPTGRLWLPEMNREAEIFPAELTLRGAQRAELEIEGHPYRVVMERRP